MNLGELPCTIGCIVFSVAAIRAGVVPRQAAALMLIGAAVFSVPLVFGIGLALLVWSYRTPRL